MFVAACGQNTTLTPSREGGGAQDQSGFAKFSDVPIPTSADIKMDRSFIFGTQDAWIGRVVLSDSNNVGTLYDFYKANTPKYGWEEITTVRSAVSVLTYSRGERVLTVQIQSRTVWGAEVDLTVSPRGSASGMPGSLSGGPLGGGAMPPVGRVPMAPVQRGP
jgi:hypothetical protein